MWEVNRSAVVDMYQEVKMVKMLEKAGYKIPETEEEAIEVAAAFNFMSEEMDVLSRVMTTKEEVTC